MWTLNKDNVANHSFYVAIYAHQIAKLIGWDGHVSRLLFMALTHDLDETVTGDIVSPVKRAIIDGDKYQSYVGAQMQQRMPDIWEQAMRGAKSDPEISAIIDVADRLDALLFLIVEQRMGNHHVFSRCQDALQRVMDAWLELPAPKEKLKNIWDDIMRPAIEEHKRFGSSGI